MSSIHRAALLAGLAIWPLAGQAFGQAATNSDTVFVLGRVRAGPEDSTGQKVGGSEINAEEMRTLDARTVDQAINYVPGAVASNTGGSRNERLIYLRGFDRFQTTLMVDGVRVFLPADNRIDFGRFLTADIAQIQVAKGYVSVLDGPGAVGGEINIVTRKPGAPLEAELVTTLNTDSDLGWTGNTVSALLGTRGDQFYAQISGDVSRRGNFRLSDDFTPVVTALEDSGKREHSSSHDWRANLKFGWTPNDTDEYAIAYVRQSGAKNAPYHISDTASTRFWSWPYWDIDSVYFLSTTQLGDALNLKTRVYRNTFQNLLSSYDSAAQDVQSLPRAFNSYYDDTAWGMQGSLAWTVAPTNTLTGAFNFREDEHNERQYGFVRTPATGNPFVNAPYGEPWQGTKEDTYSVALEDVQKLGDAVDLVVGASYDWTDLKSATDANVLVTGTTVANSVISFLPVNYPLRNLNGFNGQGALIWRLNDTAKLHASVSSRTRFPTLFEQFSSRMGTAVPNPDIDPERATNYEIGGAFDPTGAAHLEGAVFYSDIEDALIQIPVALGAPFGTVNQTKNAGSGKYYGVEAEWSVVVGETVTLGGNATYIKREFTDPTNANFRLQGVPSTKAFFYLDWRPVPQVKITPSLDVSSKRYTVTSSSLIAPPQFYQAGAYTLLNLAADWAITEKLSLLIGGKNLTDKNYTLVDGFPEEGRSFYVSARVRY